MNYCAGLLFSRDREHVLLVDKRRPAWQAGRLNAIGGKLELRESPLQAMHREFFEEAGVSGIDWKPLAALTGPNFHVAFYVAFDDVIDQAYTAEDEPILKIGVRHVLQPGSRIIENLRVLIPLALDTTGIVKPVHFYDEQVPVAPPRPLELLKV